MSQLIGILLALVSLAVTTCRALPDFHKQMTPQQLQSIFHVDTPNAVPHYEVVQLLHHDTQEPDSQQHHSHYRRRKRSVEMFQQLQDLKTKDDNSLHVKKYLSKNPYYSETKEKSTQSFNANSLYQTEKGTQDIKEHKVSFNAFGKDMNLTLKPTQGLFKNGQVHQLPMWYLDNEANATHGLNLQKIEDEHNDISDNVGQVFQDEENMAAILMRRHEVTGDLVMEGSIGLDLVIKPLPHDLTPHRRESQQHVIYKRGIDNSEPLSDFAFMEPDDLASSEKLEKLQNRHKRSAHQTTLEDIELEEEQLEADEGLADTDFSIHKRPKRQAPFIIYPEILVIVDYDGYRLHGGDNLQVKRYFISFWNGVDLRYRLLKGPKIRISIAGIIISRGRDATPYLERNRVGRDAIDSAAALTDMGKYLFRERRLPVYDIAVAITKYDMCRRRKGGRCTKGTAGFAYVGGACVVNKRLEKVNSVAIIEDTGGFSGIIVAAHEVGHLLGAVHDGSPPPSYLGGPGAQRCRWEDGYIMSDLRHTERGFRWSPCTVQSFHHFLNGDTATCLHNAPHEDSALGRSLPGTLLSLDAQCRRDRGTYACFKDERVCAQLFCFDAQTGYCVAYRPAAEGSSCGDNLHCLDGRCTPLPSNVIPDYGQQYRAGYKNHDLKDKTKGTDYSSKTKDDEEEDDDNENEDEDDNEEDDADEDEEGSSDDEEAENEDKDNENDDLDKNYNDNETSNNNNNDSNNDDNNDDDDELYLNDEYNTTSNPNKIFNIHNYNFVNGTTLKTEDQNSLHLIKYNTDTAHNTDLFNVNISQYFLKLWQNFQTTNVANTTTNTATTKKSLIIDSNSNKKLSFQSHQDQGVGNLQTNTKSSTHRSSESIRHHSTTQQHNHTLDTTTTSPTTATTTSTLLTNLSKQFQYLLKLIQANISNNNNSRNSRYLNNNKPNYNRQTILPSTPYSNSLQNAGTNVATNNKENDALNPNDDDDPDENEEEGEEGEEENDDVDNEGNGGEDNDESNETIEKLKRKLSIPLTTKTLQLQQQLQQQLPTTALPPTSIYLATAAPQYGSKSTSSSTAGRSSLTTSPYFENYFKKIQNQNNNLYKPTSTTSAEQFTTINDYKKKSKINKTVEKQRQHPKIEADNEDEKSVNTFEAKFLKRTPKYGATNENDNDTDNDNDNYSSSSLNTNNPYFITKSTIPTIKTTASRSNNIYHNNKQTTNEGEQAILTTRTQTPLYVTNYIGDNTQLLTTISHKRQKQQQHQQQQNQEQSIQKDTIATTTLQQYNSHRHASTTTQSPPTPPPPPSKQQFESFHLFSSTTRRPKIKTQKLIRRLRTQIK